MMKNFVRYFRRVFVLWVLLMAVAVVFIAIMGQRVQPAITVAIMIICFIGIPILYPLGTLILNPLLKRQWRSAGAGTLICVGIVAGGLVLIDVIPKVIASLGPTILPGILIIIIIAGALSNRRSGPPPSPYLDPRADDARLEDQDKKYGG